MPELPQLVADATAITLHEEFRRAIRIYAERTAVVSPTSSMTYAELGVRANRTAHALLGLGLRRGARIAVLAENRPEFVETYLATANLGVTVIALNIRMHHTELADCIRQAAPTLLVTTQRFAPLAAQLRATTRVAHWYCYDPVDGFADWADALAAASPDPPDAAPGPEDIHNVLYTSGTTGRSKGAMISQRAAATRGLRIAQWLALRPDDGYLGALPLFHCGGDEPLYATLCSGGIYATLPKVETQTLFALTERYRLSWAILVPGIITEFLHHPRRREFDLSSLRVVGTYANMMPRVSEEFAKTLNCAILDAFGQTETSLLVAHGWVYPGIPATLRKTPTPLMSVRLVDEDMNEVDVGVPGECVVRGPTVMSGYLGNPDATAETFAGGWLHTGDVMVRHPDGTLTYTDRKKYLIKTGGENVYPAEIEEVIAEHEAVSEVGVCGVPDDRWGETVKATIVLRAGYPLSIAEVDAWCRARLAGYKRPRYVEFRAAEDMPRSMTGKLQRHELAALPVTPEQRVPQ
jgi:fatty-acyl-CoA synthase